MKKYQFITTHKKMLADTLTPVSIYLALRDLFPGTILLESSDYHSKENSLSYICCKPVANIKINDGEISEQYPGEATNKRKIKADENFSEVLFNFISNFQTDDEEYKLLNNGIFGYCTFDAVQYFEDIKFKTPKHIDKTIPDAFYQLFQIVLVVDHFKNELHFFEHLLSGINNFPIQKQVLGAIQNRNSSIYKFETQQEEESNLTDEQFIEMVEQGKKHCFRGDVFQMVLSRRFSQNFKGDEFNVYRTLRSVNPSPYLFYFDFIDFKIFGSSPEAHLIVKNKEAEIHPIAGTYKRTGNDEKDAELAIKLSNDEKENAEHVMLVDLARNDLSVFGEQVKVETYREVQYFSHVIHLVSKVKAKVKTIENGLKLIGSTFPAGTLSGAPKYKALQLIDKYENENRSFYGGAIGIIGFDGSFNHAIIIRSILSKNNKLLYQAGAGVVSESNSLSENQEVFNKIAAIRSAIQKANKL